MGSVILSDLRLGTAISELSPKVTALPQHDNILQISRFVGLAVAEPNQKVCDSIPFHQHVEVSLGGILNPKLLLLAVPLVCGCAYECCYWSWCAGGALHDSLYHQCLKWWMHCFSLCVKVYTANTRLQFPAALESLVLLGCHMKTGVGLLEGSACLTITWVVSKQNMCAYWAVIVSRTP